MHRKNMHAAGVLFPVCIYTPVLSLVPRPSAADGLGTRLDGYPVRELGLAG